MAMQKDYHNISNNMVSLGGVLDSLESHLSSEDELFTTVALHPFHRNKAGEFWTSASVRDHTVFSYTYPELVGLTEDETLVRRVNRLYGDNATSQFTWKLGDPLPSTAPGNGYTHSERRSVSSPQTGAYQYQYFANIRVQRSGSDGAFKVFVFVGPTNQATMSSYDATAWMRDATFVGFTGFQSTNSHGDGYAGDPSLKHDANGVVALTKALEDRLRTGQLASLDETAVGEYLRQNMTWKIITADHQIVAPEDTPGFEIEVSYAKIKPPTPDSFPEMQDGGYKHLLRATSGRAGGAQEGS
ncbi:hypothetical protein N0V94_004403 [Neodidymelliopsis sp. IMI 364377]|nr:hypothetical protein N0V94_004403 [Neodidymelliopsis sp. IMI 364377]